MQGDDRDISVLVRRLGEDDGSAAALLLPLVYGHLRDLAAHYFARQAPEHTLQPTALVHEAYLKLVGQDPGERSFRGREHFLAVAARAMRQVLVDHARHRNAERRDAGRTSSLESGIAVTAPELGPAEAADQAIDVVRLDEALRRLGELDPRKAEIITLHHFGGLEQQAIAEVLGISRATVVRELTFARAWLGIELQRESGG